MKNRPQTAHREYGLFLWETRGFKCLQIQGSGVWLHGNGVSRSRMRGASPYKLLTKSDSCFILYLCR